MDLRERCREMVRKIRYGVTGEVVEDLMTFVIAETGRAAEPKFDSKMPLCLYFDDAKSREEFIAMWRQIHPNATVKKSI